MPARFHPIPSIPQTSFACLLPLDSLHLGHWNSAASTRGRTAEQRATVPLTETKRPTMPLLRADMGVSGSRLEKRTRRHGRPLWRMCVCVCVMHEGGEGGIGIAGVASETDRTHLRTGTSPAGEGDGCRVSRKGW